MLKFSSFYHIFKRERVLLPVIHCRDAEQTKQNVEIARAQEADGVFLINHTMSAEDLLWLYRKVRIDYPQMWIGLNLLGVTAETAIRLVPEDANALWTDNCCIQEDEPDPGRVARRVWEALGRRHWLGLYFGGFDFKYQKPMRDLTAMVRIAAPVMHVVTTSGPGTGKAADVERIKTIREAILEHPIGIASGITVDNVETYLPYVNAYLVATGINITGTDNLHPGLLRRLREKIHAY